MRYFFCIRSSSILCTVMHKVEHMTAKIIQSSNTVGKKTVRCKEKVKRERWQINDT